MENKIVQAIILSAGFGTRLRPLTDTMPKVMLPFSGKPLLEHHIEHFKKHGVREFFINLHYLPEVITDYFGDGKKLGVKINYALEKPEILGTAGGMKNFDGKTNENFFLVYGDVFALVDYSRLAEIYVLKPRPNLGMELARDTDHPEDSDLAELDENMRFRRVYPKPHKELPRTRKGMSGIFIFNKRIMDYIPPERYWEIDHQLLPEIIQKGEVFYGCDPAPTDFWKDIGTMKRYKEAEEYLKSQSLI